MSSRDKTREKLMGSMRKTKAVAGIGSDNVNTEVVTEQTKPTAVAKPSPAAKVKKAAPANAQSSKLDAYQSGRRIWPD